MSAHHTVINKSHKGRPGSMLLVVCILGYCAGITAGTQVNICQLLGMDYHVPQFVHLAVTVNSC